MAKTLWVEDQVRPKVVELKKLVREYESDTFSASSAELTDIEVDQIVVALINHALQGMIDCDTLDGVRLSEELENIRPEEEEEDEDA